ncbi:MAG: HNH endonuclease [Rubricoccaceae bacterium]|nr:HNH endonuclease [Rubricoccaceae bacterium]
MSALSGHVLVLNQDYRALAVCSVERALVLVFLHKAELVEAHADRHVRSARAQYPWPSIVRLKAYVRVPYRRIMLTRRNVLRRDGHRCQYCGSRERLTLDHVLPKSRGGPDAWDNLVAACVPCNNRKGNRTPEEAQMTLRRRPFRPSHVMYLRDFLGALDDSWRPYLYAA